jgi:hypothetical protein
MANWAATGSGSYYKDMTVQEIVDVKEDTTFLERVFTITDCISILYLMIIQMKIQPVFS